MAWELGPLRNQEKHFWIFSAWECKWTPDICLPRRQCHWHHHCDAITNPFIWKKKRRVQFSLTKNCLTARHGKWCFALNRALNKEMLHSNIQTSDQVQKQDSKTVLFLLWFRHFSPGCFYVPSYSWLWNPFVDA